MLLEGNVTTNAECLALHKRRMKNADFHRLSVLVSDELAQHLANERRQWECGGPYPGAPTAWRGSEATNISAWLDGGRGVGAKATGIAGARKEKYSVFGLLTV